MKKKTRKKLFRELGPPPPPPCRIRFEGSAKLSNQNEHDSWYDERQEWKRKFQKILNH